MTLKKAPLFLVFSFFSLFTLTAQDSLFLDTLLRNRKMIVDDPVIYMLDSLSTLKIFEDAEFPKSNQYQNWSTYTDDVVPMFHDSVYRERIADMNEQSPFEYIYNSEVKNFIELYAVRKRKLTARILGLAQIYFPLFEEHLDKYNMPLELKYLAVIESALNPIATSPVGARGLWQFMYGTGKVYGLKVSSYVDDRYDPYKSTIAACEHLGDLYDIYGNWSLALAAYNSGAGNVNKAIRRSGGVKNFWAIYNYLPRETRSYVPAFIAASYVMTHANDHKIYPVDPGILYYEVDTVTVTKPLTFDQIHEMLEIPMDEIRFLNPSFKLGIIPATPESPYKLRLRKKYVGTFINNESYLYAYKTKTVLSQDSMSKMLMDSYREADLYTVKSGETVASIAKKFHMTTSELKTLNNLKSNTLKPKRKILVYKTPPKSSASSSATSTYVPQKVPGDTTLDKTLITEEQVSKPGATSSSTPKYHTVKQGETLSLIAGKYHCTVKDIQTWNNLQGSIIKVGQKLKVGTSSSDSSPATVQKPAATQKPATTQKPQTASSGYIYYTIKQGDNLWELADRYNVTVSQIKSLNKIKNANTLRVGQKIKIPK